MSDEDACTCLRCRFGRAMIDYAKAEGTFNEATGQAALNAGEVADALAFLMNSVASGMDRSGADTFWLAMALSVAGEMTGQRKARPHPGTCH